MLPIWIACVVIFGPAGETLVGDANEPGEQLEITGIVVDSSGNPVVGAQVTIWHTDSKGYYSAGNEGEPRLKATAATDQQGRYAFRTIKPASYAGEEMAAHVHFRVTAAGHQAVGATIHFAGDPYLSESQLEREKAKGHFGDVVQLSANDEGILRARRDFRLE